MSKYGAITPLGSISYYNHTESGLALWITLKECVLKKTEVLLSTELPVDGQHSAASHVSASTWMFQPSRVPDDGSPRNIMRNRQMAPAEPIQTIELLQIIKCLLFCAIRFQDGLLYSGDWNTALLWPWGSCNGNAIILIIH